MKHFEEFVSREIGPTPESYIRKVESRPQANRHLVIASDFRRRNELSGMKERYQAFNEGRAAFGTGKIDGISENYFWSDLWFFHLDTSMKIIAKRVFEEVERVDDLYYSKDTKTIVAFTNTREYGVALRNLTKVMHTIAMERLEERGFHAHWRRAGIDYICADCGKPIKVGEMSWSIDAADIHITMDSEKLVFNQTPGVQVLIKSGKLTPEKLDRYGSIRLCQICFPPPNPKVKSKRQKKQKLIEEELRRVPKYQAIFMDEKLNIQSRFLSPQNSIPIEKPFYRLTKERLMLFQLSGLPIVRFCCVELPSKLRWQLDWFWDLDENKGVYELSYPGKSETVRIMRSGAETFKITPKWLKFDNGIRVQIQKGIFENI